MDEGDKRREWLRADGPPTTGRTGTRPRYPAPPSSRPNRTKPAMLKKKGKSGVLTSPHVAFLVFGALEASATVWARVRSVPGGGSTASAATGSRRRHCRSRLLLLLLLLRQGLGLGLGLGLSLSLRGLHFGGGFEGSGVCAVGERQRHLGGLSGFKVNWRMSRTIVGWGRRVA